MTIPRSMTLGSRLVVRAVIFGAVLGAFGCTAAPAAPVAPKLLPPETYNWTDRAVEVSPPEGWGRDGELSGGLKGVRFTRGADGVGESIGVAEYYLLADRDRRVTLRGLLEKFNSYSPSQFAEDVSKARPRRDAPFSPLEAEIAAVANDALDRAVAAFFAGDTPWALTQLEAAVAAADRLSYTIDDVVGAVMYAPEKHEEPALWSAAERRASTVSGEPAVVVDYTFKLRYDVTLHGRETYVVHLGRLFVLTFLGRQTSLPVFDAVVGSVEFPR